LFLVRSGLFPGVAGCFSVWLVVSVQIWIIKKDNMKDRYKKKYRSTYTCKSTTNLTTNHYYKKLDQNY
jgi:hypothetical protein